MINFTQLKALCEVVREGSFAAAGRRLGYTASAIAQQVASLERSAGVTLFEREARGIRATPAARYVAARGEEVLMAIEDFGTELVGLAGGAHGQIRFGSFPLRSASRVVVPKVLATLLEAHPDADVQLDEGNTASLLAGVVDGRLDLAVVHQYVLVPEHWPAGINVVELMNEELHVILPAEHPSSAATDFRLEDLSNERWISTQDDAVSAKSLRRICASHGFVPRVAFRSNDYDVVRGLVRAGAGVAIVPQMGYSPDSGVRRIRLEEWTPGRQVLAVHRSGNSNPLLAEGLAVLTQAFSDYAAKRNADF